MESCKNGADLEQIMNYKTRHLKTRFFSFINDQNIPSSLIGGGGVRDFCLPRIFYCWFSHIFGSWRLIYQIFFLTMNSPLILT